MFKTALKHDTMRSYWQRLRGSEIRAWAPPRQRISDPPKVLPYFAHCHRACCQWCVRLKAYLNRWSVASR